MKGCRELAVLSERLTEVAKEMKKDNSPSVKYVLLASSIIGRLAQCQMADGIRRNLIPEGNRLDYKCGDCVPKTVGIFTTEHFAKWISSAVDTMADCGELAEGGLK